ncbi:hypothetical protein FACS1894139_13150 [Planctomycetales bacterium]|nr:hypothetical protein FACS1894107_05080 [Planctomycetales bacterium]GHS99895.1 hypothetical protein FACS1894108_10770 [Planctomycetales bacterium]GHT06694.1 hypothetical protein FACS1894139_13150 [Planctomycetales bacterium]
MFIPTRNALFFGAALFVCTAAAWFLPVALIGAAGVFLLFAVLALVDFYRLRGGKNNLTVQRRAPAIAPRGVDFSVELLIKNHAPRAVSLRLRDVPPALAAPPLIIRDLTLAAHADARLTYTLKISRRGEYAFGATWWRERGFLFAAQWSTAAETTVKIYPEVIAAHDELAAARGAATAEKLRARDRGAGMEFLHLAPFRRGDALRHIDWRASARRQKLMARRHQIEQHREVLILLDSGRLMGLEIGGGSKLDYAVNSALMLGVVAGRRGDQCGLGVFADKVVAYLPPQSRGQPAWLAGQLCALKAEFRETDFRPIFATLQERQKKRALIVVLSDLADDLASANFRAALTILARRHLVIFAALRSPQLRQRLDTPAADWRTAAEQAVIYRLERDRAATLQTLSRGGVEVIDVVPTELTAPLLNRYLQVRESGRL